MLLVLLLFVLLELVLDEVCANGTDRSAGKTAYETTAGRVGSPPSGTASGKCSTQSSFAVGSSGSARSTWATRVGVGSAVLAALVLTVGLVAVIVAGLLGTVVGAL